MYKYTISLIFILSFFYSTSHAQKSRGIIKGVVRSEVDNSAIEGAIITVVGDTIVRRTSVDGSYAINNAPLGYHSLYIVADSYKSQMTESFEVTASTPLTINIKMEVTKAETVVVTASAPLRSTIESPVSLRKISREEIDLTPGANRDISKVIQSSPGVVTVSANNRNDVLVRGGGANENKYFLDDIEIPVLNHFSVQGGSGGYASLVNTELLNGVNFYTGAFPAALSNGLSSVLDMRMKSGNPDKFHAKFVLGASDAGISIDTPVSKDGKTTFIGSYRVSYLQLLFDVLQLPFLPTYNDFQFKLKSQVSDNDEIFLLGLGSFDNNKLNLNIKKPTESRNYILGYLPNNDQISYVIGAGWRHSFEGGQFKITLSRDYLHNELFKFANNDESKDKTLDIDSKEQNYRFRAAIDIWNVKEFKISAGFGGGYGDYSSNSMQRIFTNNSYNDYSSHSKVSLWRYDAFATVSRAFFDDKFSVLVGLRMDGMTYSNLTSNPLQQLSPRLSLGYKFSDKWSVSATIARYYQEPTYTTLGYASTNDNQLDQRKNLRYVNVNQYLAGVKFSPNASSQFILEGFFKQYGNLPVSLIDSLPISTGNLTDYIVGNVPARSIGKGRAYGAEISYRNLNFHNTVINVSYTLLYSQVNKLDGDLKPVADQFWNSTWDVRHIFNIYAIHKFPKNWTLGLKWYFTGGLPYTPYDYELSSDIGSWQTHRRPLPENGQYNYSRTGVYHQLDLRVDKVWYFKKWKLGFYVDIQNLYNFKSSGQEFLLPEVDANGQYVIDPNKPGHYLMKSLENGMGGTILPTLGITIEF